MTDPYYQDELVTLYHGDCREVVEWLDAGVLITDPPYGQAYVSNRARSGPSEAIADDDTTEARDDVLELWGHTKPALVFGTWKVQRPKRLRHLLVWDKGNDPGTGDLSMPWGNSAEEVYVFGAGWNGTRRSNVLRFPRLASQSGERPNHPTPKPLGLMEHLISYAPPGVIADPFAGSGSTLVAARSLGRSAIGVEVKREYCDLIVSRLAQGSLFAQGVA